MGSMFEAVGDRDMVVTRTFDAPRETVWRAWTACEHVPAWSGPAGWELARCEVDLRPGGSFTFVYKGPGGYEVPQGGTYDEVVEPERLVTTQNYDGVHTTTHTLVLTDEGGRTHMSYRVEYPTTEIRDAALGPEMQQGMDIGYDRLAEHLRSMG